MLNQFMVLMLLLLSVVDRHGHVVLVVHEPHRGLAATKAARGTTGHHRDAAKHLAATACDGVGHEAAVAVARREHARHVEARVSGDVVEDVPDVMYINMDAEALHGAYWHNNFGQRMSHGCINQPLEFADFLYGWAPLGTVVWVHE